MANVTTLGLNVGQNQYDIVATTGTSSPSQQVQLVINTDAVTVQQAVITAMIALEDYIVSRGWPVA